MNKRNQLIAWGWVIFVLTFFSFSFAQDCPECPKSNEKTFILANSIPIQGLTPTNNQQMKSTSDGSNLNLAFTGTNSSFYFTQDLIYRKIENNTYSSSIDSAVIYTGDQQLFFDVTISASTGGDFWYPQIEFPDGRLSTWPKVIWRNNRFWYENGTPVFDDPNITSPVANFTCGVQDLRCRPVGVWKLSLFHNDIPVKTVKITANGGSDIELVKYGEVFTQGTYDHPEIDEECMDSACRYAGASQSHFCNNPLLLGEYYTTIKMTGCLLTSGAIMLNYHSINITPPKLNTWLKRYIGIGYDKKQGKPVIYWYGYSPESAGNLIPTAFADYARNFGFSCSMKVLKTEGQVLNVNELRNYICQYGPQILGVRSNSPGHMHEGHWVCVYGWLEDNEGNVIDWLISDPATGGLRTINKAYQGHICAVYGFEFSKISSPNLTTNIQVRLHSPAELLITDGQGRRSGYDPLTNQLFNDIPGASYFKLGGIEDDTTGEFLESDTKILNIPNADLGTYTLTVTGTGNGTYNMEIIGLNQANTNSTIGYGSVPVSPLEVHTYQIKFDGIVENFEAEQMDLINYTVETNSSASGGNLVRLSGNTGTASFIYPSTSGTKDLKVWYYDQSAFNSVYKLYINNVLIDSWTADQDFGSALIDGSTRVGRVIPNLEVNTGDSIKIEGTLDGGEVAAIDLVEISSSLAASPSGATPEFSLIGGTYNSSQSLIISCDTPGAVIHYTTDDTNPNVASPIYTIPIAITNNITIKAYAVQDGLSDSNVVSASYVISSKPRQVTTPAVFPQAGTYTSERLVTIASGTIGATIYYTTDGSIPSILSPVYTGPIRVYQTTTIKAIAVKDRLTNSNITTVTYTIQVASPSFGSPGGTYYYPQSVWLKSATVGAFIHYTTDGSTPSDSSPIFTEPIIVTQPMTIKAYAVKTGTDKSDVVTSVYDIKPFTPTFTPPEGSYNSGINVAINCETSGTIIRYTTDGSIPNDTSPVYLTPLTINQTTTINAYASKSGLNNSDVSTATYIIDGPQKVVTPTFSPTGGTYTSAQNVSISSTTNGATIRYTTDGSTPNASSPIYTGPINVAQTTTIKAYATNGGMVDSDVSTATYVINIPQRVVTPTFSPTGGTYTSAQNVSISSTTNGATIRYTTDGSTPNASSPIYTGPINVAQTTTIKAYATNGGMTDSDVSTATYIINIPQRVVTPTFSPTGGTYTSAQNVSISSTTNGATIRYTTDGSTPNASSPIYTGPINVAQTITIKAYATNGGMFDSDVSTATYVINIPQRVVTPTFSPTGGTYTSAQNVSISSTTNGATIRYTTDGSTPNASSPIYTGPINVAQTTTIKAYATNGGMVDSDVSTATYVINIPQRVVTPTFSPTGGTYTSAQNVSISSTTNGATIRYTTDGSTPNASSPIYTGPINVAQTTTIKAYATNGGMTDSDVSTATYIINIPQRVVTPTFSPTGGTYTSAQNVSISSTTNGATIRYTTDGSTPNASSPIYTGPINVAQTITIKAYATNGGMFDSDVSTATYVINIPQRVVTPTFSPTGGTYTSAQNVSISTNTNGATIRYTTDGSTPNALSAIYTGPINVAQTTTIKAYATNGGMTDSDVSTATYIINIPQKVAVPTFSPTGGTYTSVQNVSISSTTNGATIRYTTDGSTPNASSPIYTGPINVAQTITIKAYATNGGMVDSDVSTATYVINIPQKVTTPTFSPAGGKYKFPQEISIECITPGAIIRYTIDGSTPDEFSTVYSGPITIDKNITIRAFAVKEGFEDSNVSTVSYLIGKSQKVERPIFSPQNGSYDTPQVVSITCATPGAIIRYTLDGSRPDESSLVYNGPILVIGKTIIRAYSTKEGFEDSSTVTASYVIHEEK